MRQRHWRSIWENRKNKKEHGGVFDIFMSIHAIILLFGSKLIENNITFLIIN